MINENTFSEFLKTYPEDHFRDFILKTIQADVIISKTEVTNENIHCFLESLVAEHAHNGIEKRHYDYAIALYFYQCSTEMKGLGGCDPRFPSLSLQKIK